MTLETPLLKTDRLTLSAVCRNFLGTETSLVSWPLGVSWVDPRSLAEWCLAHGPFIPFTSSLGL